MLRLALVAGLVLGGEARAEGWRFVADATGLAARAYVAPSLFPDAHVTLLCTRQAISPWAYLGRREPPPPATAPGFVDLWIGDGWFFDAPPPEFGAAVTISQIRIAVGTRSPRLLNAVHRRAEGRYETSLPVGDPLLAVLMTGTTLWLEEPLSARRVGVDLANSRETVGALRRFCR